MPSIYTYPRIDELSLKNLLIVSEVGGRNSRGIVYSTKSTTLGEIVELVVDTLAVGDFDEGIRNSQIDIQTDLLSLESRIDDVEGGVSTYATNTRVDEVKSTLEGSIASSTLSLEAGYRSYTDDALTSYSTSTATQQLIAEATADKATSQSVTDLRSEIQTDLGNYSTTTATQALITTATADKATSQSVTDLSSRIFDPTTNTLSQSFANSVMTTESTTDYATASDVTELQSQFTFDSSGGITGTSGALNTEIAAASSNTSQAFATKVSNLEAQFTLNNGVPDGLSSSNIQAIQTVIAGDGYATSTDITTLNSAIGQNSADISTVNTTIANETSARTSAISALQTDVNGNTADISSNATAISNETSARISADQTLQTDVNNNTAGISNNATLISNETSARASAISALQTTVNGNTASITSNATAISNETSARASAVSGLQSSIGGNTASIGVNQSTIATVDGKLNSSYGINVDANGVVAGLKLLSNGTTSDMEFAADKFKFTNGSGTLTPFSIDTVNNKINFTGDVVFSSSYGDSDVQSYIDTVGEIFTTTTTISGGQIETGLIKNSTYPHSAGHSGYATTGMGIDLDNGSIHAEEFYINSDGTSNFKGVHSAGRLGNWVVTGNALKSGQSNPSIVFDPTGNYTETGSEKVVVSAVNLPTISPSAGVNLDFERYQYSGGTIISSAYSIWAGYPHSVSGTMPTHNLTGTNGYFTTPNDITVAQDAFGESNNIGYEHPGGNLEFSMPYAAGTNHCTFDTTVQERFLQEWGATFTTDPWDSSIRNRTNPSLNKIGIVEFDYSVKLVTKMYRGSSSDTATTVQNATLEQTFTKTLDSGTKLINLNDFVQISNQSTDNTYPYSNMNTSDANSDALVDTIYYSAQVDFGNWNDGTQTQGATPINISAGKIFLISSIEYKIEDIRFWRSTSFSGSSYASGGRFYASLYDFGGWYSSGGGYNASATALTQVLFKGGDPKINIGLNGTQVRGREGYVALGDITSTNSIAQFWGDTEVIGTITTNSTATFSDERLKQNIAPIKNSIETIKLLNPVTYKWDRNKLNVSGTKHGFIAQEVRDIIPSTVLDGKQIADVEDALAVEYNNFIAINTSAIKELIQKIEALEQEIQILKNK